MMSATVAGIHLRGLAAGRPAAASVGVGTLYYSTDTGVVERSTGAAWETYSATLTDLGGLDETAGDARYAQRANNLSDLASAATARTNLGLSDGATLSAADLAELIRDTIGTALLEGANIDLTVNDAGDTITVAVTGIDAELIRDTIAAALTAGTGLTVTVDDPGNTITVALNINGLTAEATVDGAADWIPFYDTSAGAIRKLLPDNLPGGGAGGHTIEADGTPLAARSALNFILGASGATVTDNAGTDATDVDLSALTAGGGGHTIEDNGTPLTQRGNLNFILPTGGAISDDAGGDATVVDLSGIAAGLGDLPIANRGELAYGASEATENRALTASGASATTSGMGGPSGANAIDGNDASSVNATEGNMVANAQTITVDLGAVYNIVACRLKQYTGSNNASTVEVESSEDNSAWTGRHTLSSLGGDTGIVTLATPATARYWRMRVTASANAGHGWNVYTVEFRSGTLAGEVAALPLGSAGRVLTAYNNNIAWRENAVEALLTTKGDLIIGAADAQTNEATAAQGATFSAINMGTATAANAFDSNDATSANSSVGTMIGQALRTDLGSAKLIRHARLLQAGGANQAATVVLESSEDDVSWAVRHTFNPAGTESGRVPLDTAMTARYWRVRVIASANPGGGWNVYSVELWSGVAAGEGARLAVGANGAVLIVNGSGQVAWLAPGTDGQVLKMVSGAPAWAAP
jgi:hypothetical protein